MHVVHLHRRHLNGDVEQLLAGVARVAGRPVQDALLGRDGAAVQVIRGAGGQRPARGRGPGVPVSTRDPAAVQVFSLRVLVAQVERGVAVLGEPGGKVLRGAKVLGVVLGRERQALFVGEGVLRSQP